MLFFKDVPVVIEPGVAALEVGIISANAQQGSKRLFYVVFERVHVTDKNVDTLPFVPTSQNPHIFSMSADVDASPFILVYDLYGRLTTVYTRDPASSTWMRSDTAPEQIGETITQFSARFSFNTSRERDRFLNAMEKVSSGKYTRSDVESISIILRKSKSAPVVLPVALALPQKSINV